MLKQIKARIREAATRLFVERGYELTSILDIARAAGISKGGIFHHYRAKASLLDDIVATEVRGLSAAVRHAASLEDLVHIHLMLVCGCPEMAGLWCLLSTLSIHRETFREAFRSADEALAQRYVELAPGLSRAAAGDLVALVAGAAALRSVRQVDASRLSESVFKWIRVNVEPAS